MAGPLDVKGRVSIRDLASGPLARIANGLRAIGRHSGVNAVGRSFHQLGGAMANFGSRITGLLGPLAALTGLGAGFGVTAAIIDFSRSTDDAVKFGRTMGLTAQQVREMGFVAERSGTSLSAMQRATFALNKRIGELKVGTGSLYAFLDKTGNKALIEQFKNSKSLNEQMFLTAKAYQAFEKDGKKGMAFLSSAASRAGAVALARTFVFGVEGFRELTARARVYLGVISKSDENLAEHHQDSITNLMAAWSGAARMVSREILPMLTPMINGLAAWIARNRQLIGVEVGEWFASLKRGIDSIDWDATWAGFKTASKWLGEVIKKVGGFKNVLIGVGILAAAPFIASLGYMVVAVAGVAAAILGISTAPLLLIAAAAAYVWYEWEWFEKQWNGLFDRLQERAKAFADWFDSTWVGRLLGAFQRVVGVGQLAPGTEIFGPGGPMTVGVDTTPTAAQAAVLNRVRRAQLNEFPARLPDPGRGAGAFAAPTGSLLRQRAAVDQSGRADRDDHLQATLDINLPSPLTGSITNGGPKGLAFDFVGLNRGASMRRDGAQ